MVEAFYLAFYFIDSRSQNLNREGMVEDSQILTSRLVRRVVCGEHHCSPSPGCAVVTVPTFWCMELYLPHFEPRQRWPRLNRSVNPFPRSQWLVQQWVQKPGQRPMRFTSTNTVELLENGLFFCNLALRCSVLPGSSPQMNVSQQKVESRNGQKLSVYDVGSTNPGSFTIFM